MHVEEILAAYRKNGYAHVPNVVPKDALDAMRARADDIMHGRVTYEGMFFQLDTTSGNYHDLEFGNGWQGPSDNYRKIEKLERDPIFRAWIDSPLVERIVRGAIDGDVTMYRAILMTKAARGGTTLPWHQDAGKFWGLDRDPPIQIWTALDDAPIDAGCVEVFPESHARGLVTPLGGVVPEEHARARDAEKHAVRIPARAGDLIVLHNLAWHRSGVNRTDRTRRAFSVCYMSALTKCTRTKKTPRTFLPVFRG
jgi:ectoine hydroxylase-related dioxygenase (phytanoyl-CoA dioxygenase family)